MVIMVALIIYVLIPSDGSFIFRTKHIVAVAILVAFAWNLRSNIIIILPALIVYLLFFKWYKNLVLLLVTFGIAFVFFGKGFDMLWAHYGFWKDDAQVACEMTYKFYGSIPGLYIQISEI